jgi:hypothetical protein
MFHTFFLPSQQLLLMNMASESRPDGKTQGAWLFDGLRVCCLSALHSRRLLLPHWIATVWDLLAQRITSNARN